MDSILIVDAGSTKTEWIAAGPDGVCRSACTPGINAVTSSDAAVASSMDEAFSALGRDSWFSRVYFYGAGCATPAYCARISDALRMRVADTAHVEVESDMTGAARALFGDGDGIACILGTGSNSCLYRSGKIADSIPSLGYILGDEGGGAAMGKRLVSDALKKQLPANVVRMFVSYSGLDVPEILDRIYRQPNPNRFLASLVPFIKENLWNPYIYSIALREIKKFFKRNVAMYAGARSLPVGVIGSVGVEFEDIVREAAATQGIRIAAVRRSPAEGLTEYHVSKTFSR